MKLYIMRDVTYPPDLDPAARERGEWNLKHNYLFLGFAPDAQFTVDDFLITTFRPVSFNAWLFSRHAALYRWYRRYRLQKWRKKHGDEA